MTRLLRIVCTYECVQCVYTDSVNQGQREQSARATVRQKNAGRARETEPGVSTNAYLFFTLPLPPVRGSIVPTLFCQERNCPRVLDFTQERMHRT